MRAGQTLNDGQGHEVMLFPFDEMFITQGEHGGYCIDFVGWSPQSGQILKYPYYAPCSCSCVAKGTNGDWVVFNSDNPVLCADGVVRNVCWQQGHDDTPCNVGDHFNQGDLIGHTGTTGQVSGDHCHYNTAEGHYNGWANTQLKNSMHIYDCCYVNDTNLYAPLTYPWKTYDSPTPPVPPYSVKRKKFPWFILANRLRNRNRNFN